ncbi:hypothetical protein JHK87_016139 [Glycine soja]|nr:hypothetical protein JHK87_016139 [Glycine soja]
MFTNRGRFNLLMRCTYTIKEVEQYSRLQNEMQMIEFGASQSQLVIIDKLNHGIREKKLDQAFANDMLEEIARAVGVPIEPSEISKALASIRQEREEAATRKERAELIFLE